MIRPFIPGAAMLLLTTGGAYAQAIPEVVVKAQPYNNAPLAKLDQPLIDIPQTVDVVNSEELNEQAVTSLHQALLDVPGAQNHADEDSQQGDNFYIRGFSAETDVYMDGIHDPGRYRRDSFDMQSLEVLEGPSGVVFGKGSTGGAINYVTKMPQLDPIIAGTFMLGTDDTKRLTADIDQPIDTNAAFRVNLVGEDSGFTGRDVVGYSHFGIAPSVSLGIGTPTRFTAEIFHESEFDVPDYGVPWIYTPGNVRPFFTNQFYGSEHNDFARTTADMVTLFGEHDLSDWVTIRDRFRYGSFERDMQVTEPSVNGVVTVPLSEVMVDNVIRGIRSHETTLQNQTDAVARFTIGEVSEDIVAGVEAARDTTTPTTFKYTGASVEPLLDPDPSLQFTGTRLLKSDVNSSALDLAAYVIDTTKWENWDLSLATRFDSFDATYNQTVSPAVNLHHLDELPGYRGALTYHPIDDATVYISYGTSFDPSAEALSLSSATAALAPEKTRAYEVGAKYVPRPGLLANVAVFRTMQRNVREANPVDPTTDILIGGARAEGIDLGLHGEIADHWKVWGGYEYLFATVTSSPNGDLGSRLQDAPRHSGRLWTSYELWSNELELGGGLDYVGNRTPTTLFEQYGLMQVVPSYWTLGLLVGYRVTDNVRLQLNIDNLNDSKYFDGIDDNHVQPGEGRTAFLTLRYKM